MTRFVPKGEPGIPLSRVRYSNLHSTLKAIIGPDIAEYQLLEWIIITVQKINEHMYEITDEELTEEDIRGFR